MEQVVVDLVPQERLQQRTLEQADVVLAPQPVVPERIVEQMVGDLVPHEQLQQRTLEQAADVLVPQGVVSGRIVEEVHVLMTQLVEPFTEASDQVIASETPEVQGHERSSAGLASHSRPWRPERHPS